jgi:hypothetical protein
MTTRNFRVNTGLSVGDVTVTASTNAVAGVSSITLDNSTAPSGNAVLANKKYVDDKSHSTLTNLTADDHPQYLLADGSRDVTGNLNVNGVLGITNSIEDVYDHGYYDYN